MKTIEFDIGNNVRCDDCNKDYTNDADAKGGILFGSKAYCPLCSPDLLRGVSQYGEERYIRGRAHEGETFRDFVIRIRGGNNKVRISGGDANEVAEMAKDFANNMNVKL